eukprot:12005048-Heterocapsa_arctica.AAC.1
MFADMPLAWNTSTISIVPPSFAIFMPPPWSQPVCSSPSFDWASQGMAPARLAACRGRRGRCASWMQLEPKWQRNSPSPHDIIT